MTVYFLRSSGTPAFQSEDDRDVATMHIIANRRAEASNAAWIDDIRRRKLCNANGAGNVHGIQYDLGAQFSLQLVRRDA